MTRVHDQSLIGYVFAEPDADGGSRAIDEISRVCAALPGSRTAVSRYDGALILAAVLPLTDSSREDESREHRSREPGSREGGPREARPRERGSREHQSPEHGGWAALDTLWDLAVRGYAGSILGEARIFSAETDQPVRTRTADPRLYAALRERFTGEPASRPGPSAPGTAWRAGFALWEVPPSADRAPSADRGSRRFVAAMAPSAGPAVWTLLWPDGRAGPPPLAKYLLRAARLRAARHQTAGLRHAGAGAAARLVGAPARLADALARERGDLEAMAGGVSGLTGGTGPAADSGVFAADALAAVSPPPRRSWDDADPVGHTTSSRRPGEETGPGRRPPPLPRAVGEPWDDPARDDPPREVFVIYGRDEMARRALFDFLRALGLRPLEWETLLARGGDVAPYLSDAVRTGLEVAAAVVVLMTPDDVVRLHPDLHKPRERPGEKADMLQPRPNVLIELGMALTVMNGRTILLKAGEQREITDLAGQSYVRLADTAECRARLRERLEAAGCRVTASTDWLTAGDFASLTAPHRRP